MRNDNPSLLTEDILASDSTSFAAGTFPLVFHSGTTNGLDFQWVSFVLDPTAVHKGEQLAFVLFPYQHNQYHWDEYYWASSFDDFDDKYKGGDLFAGSPDDFSPFHGVSADFLFRTYVAPVPIPEPATSLLMLLVMLFAAQFRWSILRVR